MKILVTGANGFIGSHLVEKFLLAGYSVRCLVHRNLAYIKTLPAGTVEVYQGSITQPETLTAAVKDIDFVFHTAAVLRAAKIKTFYEVNFIGTRNLLYAVYSNNSNIKRFVYISSQAAIGPSKSLTPKTMNSTCEPVSNYGKSKLLAEQEVLSYKDKLPVTILRPAAVYGPRDKDLFPFFKFVSLGFFPVLSGRNNCYVQLLFVKDLAEICYRITTQSILNENIYFLSEKSAYSWEEVCNIISNVVNKKVSRFVVPIHLVKFIAFLLENIMRLRNKPALLNTDKVKELCQQYWLGDSSAIEKELNFVFTKLSTGAKITYEWYKQNHWLN